MVFQNERTYRYKNSFLFFYYLPSPKLGLTPRGLTTQMHVGQMPVGGAPDCGPEHYTDTQGRTSLNV